MRECLLQVYIFMGGIIKSSVHFYEGMMAPVTFGSLVRGPAMSSLSRPLSPSAPLILRKNGVNMRRIAQIIVAKLARAAEE